METKAHNDNRRRGLTRTLKPMRMFDTPGIVRKNTRVKTAIQLFFLVTLCGTLLHISIHRTAKEQLGIPIYSALRKLGITKDNTVSRKLGAADCKWVIPIPVNQNPTVDVFSTLLVAYPGAAKRAAYMQFQGLTQTLTGDDFKLNYNKLNRYAFYKTQYPHHEGIWSWEDRAKQSVYVLQNPRTALQDYMFLVSEIHYSDGWLTSFANLYRTFTLRPINKEWEIWREARFNTEIHYWRWHIDYWMEGGLLRDVYTHELTTLENFDRLLHPSFFEEAELSSFQNGLVDVQPEYDGHCGNGGDMEDCTPVTIVSYEHIITRDTGLQEVAKLAAVIQNKAGINVIPEETRECVWEKIVNEGAPVTGVRDFRDRNGPSLEEFGYTYNQILLILEQLRIMYAKYNSGVWINNRVAQLLVEYLAEYIEENESHLRSHLLPKK